MINDKLSRSEELQVKHHSALLGKAFSEGLRIAGNHDDSDSTASIAGQIYGAYRAVADLPNRWIRHVEVLIPLLRLAGELISVEP